MKKNKILLGLTALFVLISFAGCSSEQKSEPVPEPTDEPKTEQVDYLQVYGDILDEYYMKLALR